MTQSAFNGGFDPADFDTGELASKAAAKSVAAVKQTFDFQGLTEVDDQEAKQEIQALGSQYQTHLTAIETCYGTNGVKKEYIRAIRTSEHNPLHGFWLVLFSGKALLNPTKPISWISGFVGLALVLFLLSAAISALSYSPGQGFKNPVDRIESAGDGFFYTE